jgi:hypothetical protein
MSAVTSRLVVAPVPTATLTSLRAVFFLLAS